MHSALVDVDFININITLGTIMKTNKRNALFTFILICATIGTANAAVIDFKTVSMTAAANSLSFIADGVGVTAEGYHVEYDQTDDSTTIYGPFSTGIAINSPNWTIPYFGRWLSTPTGEVASGLGLLATQDLGQTDTDSGGNGIQPGFDTGTFGLPSFQFALFRFDAPVDVSQVIVDNRVSSAWIAGGNTAPDFSQDFLSAFSDFSFINSSASNNNNVRSFSPFEGITYLAIGASPRASTIGDLGPINGSGGTQFFIDGINVSAVPVPAAVWLFGSGLIALIGIARGNKIVLTFPH